MEFRGAHSGAGNDPPASRHITEGHILMTSMKDLMGTVYRQSSKNIEESAQTPSSSDENAVYMKRMGNASCSGKVTGRCGETMEIYLDVDGEHIRDASFFTDGCRFSVLCGAVATLLAKGKTMDEAAEIGGDTILEVLDKIPQEDVHCAYLAGETLQAAIHDWMLK